MVPVGVAADRVYRPPMLPWGAVSSYLAFPPLPSSKQASYHSLLRKRKSSTISLFLLSPQKHVFAGAPFGEKAVYLCCTIPEVTLGGRYPLSLPCAARTFLIPEGTRPSAPVTVSIITQKTDGRTFFSCYFGLRRIKSRLSAQASASTAGKVSQTPVTPSSALSANSTGGIAMMLRTSEMIKPREACPAALK